jgi:hypothetical protein
MDAERAFEVLASGRETMIIKGTEVQIPDEATRTLLVVLHAAQHGHELRKALTDLEKALERVQAGVWERAHALALRLDALDAFSSGLRLLPVGRELVGRLRVPEARSVEAVLRASTAPDLSLAFEWLSRAPGLRDKLRFVFIKAFPPVTWVREVAGLEEAGWLRLGAWYLKRAGWMARRAPRGFLAWLAARRRTPPSR